MIYFIFNAKTTHDAYTLEDDGVYIWRDRCALQLLKQLCIQHGASFEGRKEAARKLLHITQKVPILVSENKRALFFPTRRLRDENCMWINYAAITSIMRFKQGTKVTFRNGKSIVVLCDIRGMKRELSLCEELLHLLANTQRNKV